MLDIGERLNSYEPLWENWSKDKYIGGGNFGKVYRLKQNFGGETMYSAVKIVPVIMEQELAAYDGDKKRYIEDKKQLMVQEIINMYRLKDKHHLVQCINHGTKDIFDDNGEIIGFDVLIQMNYYTSLTAYMKDKGQLSADDVKRLASQIADGLKSMHEINMLHRDIKIDNIYVDKDGNFFLGDFGIAKQEAASSYSTLAGTQPFIAPEVWKVQHTNRRYTKTADIYSYGISLYYLLNGNRLPLVEKNSTRNQIDDLIFDRLNGRPFPPPENGDDRLKAIVMKCCAYEPIDRYQSIEEVIAELEGETSIADSYLTQAADIGPAPQQRPQGEYATVFAGNENNVYAPPPPNPNPYNNGAAQYGSGGAGQYGVGAGQYGNGGAAPYNNNAPQYGSGAGQYNNGGAQFSNSGGQYNNGASPYNNGGAQPQFNGGNPHNANNSYNGQAPMDNSYGNGGYVYHSQHAEQPVREYREPSPEYREPAAKEPARVSNTGNSKLLIGLISVVAVLLLALLSLVIVFVLKNSDNDENSSSESSVSEVDESKEDFPVIESEDEPAETTAATTTAPSETTSETTTTTETTTSATTTEATTKKDDRIKTLKQPDKLYGGIEEGDIYMYEGSDIELYYGPDESKYGTTGHIILTFTYIQEHGRTKDGSWLYVSEYRTNEFGWIRNKDLTEITEYPGMSELTGYLSPSYYGTITKDTAFRRGPNDIRDPIPGCNTIKSGSSVEVVGSCPGWYYVYYGTYDGWVSSDNVTLR